MVWAGTLHRWRCAILIVLWSSGAGCASPPAELEARSVALLSSDELLHVRSGTLSTAGGDTPWSIGTPEGAVSTHYARGRGAVEQSYSVLAGGDTVRVWTPLSGDTEALTDGSLLARGPGGAMRIWGLRAWDADGRSVAGQLLPGTQGFSASLDARGARYPLTVDPYLAPVPTWSLSTTEVSAALGVAAVLGDFNGDGSLDGAIGIPGWDGAVEFGVGAVQVHFSLGAGGPVQTLEGTGTYGFFGAALLAHDVDGDGLDDLIVGAPGTSGALPNQGWAGVFLGTSGSLAASSQQWFGGEEDAEFGASLAWLDDVDGDSLVDVAVGSPGAGIGGVVTLVDPNNDAMPPRIVAGTELGARFGAVVLGGADWTGDANVDLAVGAPESAGLGRVRVFAGGAPMSSASPWWTGLGATVGAGLGSSLATLDLDGSGLADLVIGIPGADQGRGSVRVHFDGLSGLSAEHWGPPGNGMLGASLAVGDLDGDGQDDLVVGRPGAGNAQEPLVGGVTVFAGGPAASVLVPAFAHVADVAFARMGTDIAIGDLDGDGMADALVTGYLATTTGAPQGGAAWVLPGLSASADADGDGYCADVGPCALGVPGGDCNDLAPSVYPGAPELCDGVDTDCDGLLPDNEQDADADGFSPCAGDCEDDDDSIHPLAPEQCDTIDHDCDGLPANQVTLAPFYEDFDGDGVGAGESIGSGCDEPLAGQSTLNTDCDDLNAAVYPGAVEAQCNGIDDDCEVLTEDAFDQDGDGTLPCADCELVDDSWFCGDCDDADSQVHPGARERCENGLDEDCDGEDAECEAPPPCPEPDQRCDDSGCSLASTGGGAGWLWILGLLAARRRRRGVLAALLCVAMLPALASAQTWDAEGKLDTQLLRPSFAPWGFVASTGADPGPAGTVQGGVVSMYEHAPMVLRDDGNEIARIVRHRVTHTLGVWVTPVERLGFGVTLPLVFHEADWAQDDWSLVQSSPGDLEVDTLFRIVRSEAGALSVGGRVYIPTARKHSLAGEDVPRFEGRLAVQGSVGPVTGLVELRTLARPIIRTGYDFQLAPEFALLAAVRVWPVPGKLAIAVEAESRASAVSFLKRGAENPVDLRAVVGVHPSRWLSLQIGGGVGLNEGYGAPRARVLLGMIVRRVPRSGATVEPGSVEAVPEEPEPDDDLIADVDLLDDPDPLIIMIDESDPLPQDEPKPSGPLAEVTEEQIVIHAPIEFAFDSDELLETSLPVLTEVRELLGEYPELAHVLIEGHASLEGRTTYNWDLSNRRAAAVFRWLVEQGVSSVRLSYRGMGEAVPRGDTDARSAEVREQDRRVEFHIIERLDTLLDRVPDWEAEAPPIPWLMREAEDEGLDDAVQEPGDPHAN